MPPAAYKMTQLPLLEQVITKESQNSDCSSEDLPEAGELFASSDTAAGSSSVMVLPRQRRRLIKEESVELEVKQARLSKGPTLEGFVSFLSCMFCIDV